MLCVLWPNYVKRSAFLRMVSWACKIMTGVHHLDIITLRLLLWQEWCLLALVTMDIVWISCDIISPLYTTLRFFFLLPPPPYATLSSPPPTHPSPCYAHHKLQNIHFKNHLKMQETLIKVDGIIVNRYVNEWQYPKEAQPSTSNSQVCLTKTFNLVFLKLLPCTNMSNYCTPGHI